MTSPQNNNFDLIRLAAALQVAYIHSAGQFGTIIGDYPLISLISKFPGVPVFFFISGYLISKSFETNSNWRDYARNRVLRIYPALLVCFAVSLTAIWLCGFFSGRDVPRGEFIAWIAAQVTIGQVYNPPFINQPPIWGLNLSLWTIGVELQFYLLVPLMYSFLGLARIPVRRANLILLCAILAFLAIKEVDFARRSGMHSGFLPQISEALFIPWFYMFLVGVLFQRNSTVLQRWLAGRFVYVFLAYSALAVFTSHELHWALNDSPQPVLFFGLALVVFSAAFSAPRLSERLLHKNDVSYGLYIYHRPVLNVLALTGVLWGHAGLVTALVTSIALAYASWRLIEKPALTLKRRPLYKHAPQL